MQTPHTLVPLVPTHTTDESPATRLEVHDQTPRATVSCSHIAMQAMGQRHSARLPYKAFQTLAYCIHKLKKATPVERRGQPHIALNQYPPPWFIAQNCWCLKTHPCLVTTCLPSSRALATCRVSKENPNVAPLHPTSSCFCVIHT